MARRPGSSMTPEEARLFHEKALVIDSQQPGVTSGLLYTEAMHEAMKEMADRWHVKRGRFASASRP